MINQIRKYSRLILAVATLVASLSILAVIIYFYSDYEYHVILNTNIDDYTIVFMFIACALFLAFSIILFVLFIKQVKREKYANVNKRF